MYGQIKLETTAAFRAFFPGAFVQVDPDLTTIDGTTDGNFAAVSGRAEEDAGRTSAKNAHRPRNRAAAHGRCKCM